MGDDGGPVPPRDAEMPPPDGMPGERASMVDVAKRTFKNFQAHKMADHAAGLTYYAMMSLFPALLATVSVLGLVGTPGLVNDAVQYARDNGADPSLTNALDASLRGAISKSSGAISVALFIGLAVALYGASGAFGASGRALNVVYGVEDDRGFLRTKLENLFFTLVLIALAIISLISVFLGGTMAQDLLGTIGLGSTAADVWSYLRWLVALAAAVLIYAIVYAFAPDITPRRFRWLSPGAVLGVVLWIIASIGFFFYVSNFSSYGATYGAFASAVVLLLWLYITNLCLLLGGELNAELERAESAARGAPPPPTPPLRPQREGVVTQAPPRH
jgi:membrane protein